MANSNYRIHRIRAGLSKKKVAAVLFKDLHENILKAEVPVRRPKQYV